MSPWPKFVGFALFTSALTLMGNFVSMWTLCRVCELPCSCKAPLLTALACAVFLIAGRLYACLLTRILYYFVCLWWGLLIYLSTFSILFQLLNLVYQPPMMVSLAIIILPTLAFFLIGFYNSFQLKISTSQLVIPGISKSVKIVHLSDLHLGPVYSRRHVDKVVSQIKLIDPDLIVISGDLFDGSMTVDPFVLQPFSELRAKTFFALGNHDAHFLGIDEVKKSLKFSGIVLLENEQADYEDVNVIGIEYAVNPESVLKRLERQGIYQNRLNVLIYHAPQVTMESLEKYNINLCLAGHTHGGQMMPMCCKQFAIFKYVKGLHRSSSGRGYIHISVGTGTAGPPLRMFSRSTIAVLNVNS